MRLTVVVAAAVAAGWLPAQDQPSAEVQRAGIVSLGGVSIGADASGRKELCDELARLARGSDPRVVSPLSKGADLRCPGDAASDVLLGYATAPSDPRRVLCDFSRQPIALFIPHMQPFALRGGSPPIAPYDLQLKLESVLVTRLSGLFEAMDFRNLTLTVGRGKAALEVGLHEIELFCADGA